MSFSFDFHAKPADVAALLEQRPDASAAPSSVKAFIRAAVEGLNFDLVHIHAHGHLFKNDFSVSSCDIIVNPLTVAQPDRNE